MQVQIRNPVAIEVIASEDGDTVSLRFVTGVGHEAVIPVAKALLPDLLEKLKSLVPADTAARNRLRALLRV